MPMPNAGSVGISRLTFRDSWDELENDEPSTDAQPRTSEAPANTNPPRISEALAVQPQPIAGGANAPRFRSLVDKRVSSPLKAQIAFISENGKVEEKLLDLVEKLEMEHHPEEQKRQSTRDRDSIVKYTESLIIPVGQTLHPIVPMSQINFKDKQNIKTGGQEGQSPAYEHLPRPYLKHSQDIERRRARKMIDIMNSSAEGFTISEKDKRVKFPPSGTLIFHVLELFNLAINATTFIRSLPVSFYCVLAIGNLKRCSKIFHSLSARRIRVDYSANFSIEVSEWRESPTNRFSFELWSYQDPETHFIVGSFTIHIYKFIRKQHGVEILQLYSDGIKVGKVAFEYAFAYGYFGYGHSNQLRNPNNPIMETVSHSMYPRIRLDGKDISDTVYRVRMPNELKIFTYNSLILELNLDTGSQSEKQRASNRKEVFEPKPMALKQVKFENDKPVHCKLHMNIWQSEIQPDFNDAYGEYICQNTRRNRLEYLSNLVGGRMRDIRETEAGWLFRPIKERDAEKVVKTDVHPGLFIHPQKIPCPDTIVPVPLDKEDEKFQDEFPAVRRETGFLSLLFGYSPKPDQKEFLNDMDYPLYQEAGKTRSRMNMLSAFNRFFIRIGAYLNFVYNFVFPEIRSQPLIPEISVTRPSPEGSTTNIYTYFLKDQKDGGLGKVEKLQAQTAALIDYTDRVVDEDDEEEEDQSSSSDDGDGAATKPRRKSLRQAGGIGQGQGFPKAQGQEVSGGPNKGANDPVTYHKPVTTAPVFQFKAGVNQPIQR